MTKTEKRIFEIQTELKRKGVELPFHTIQKIRRSAITLRKYFECSCNGCTREKLPFESWANYDKSRDAQMNWIEKRTDVLRNRIERECNAVNVPFYIQSDPRGCSLYLMTTDESRYNTQGVAIY